MQVSTTVEVKNGPEHFENKEQSSKIIKEHCVNPQNELTEPCKIWEN